MPRAAVYDPFEAAFPGKKVEKFEGWKDPQRVYEFDDGWHVSWLSDPHDQAVLGKWMHHCSGTHWIWTIEERIWYFLALCDPDTIPHTTLHAKQATWLNKRHPRDNAERMPIGNPPRTMGSYPCYADIMAAFKSAKVKYEPGKYRPWQFESCTYDRLATNDYDYESLEYRYGGGLINGGRKPPDIDDEVWEAYIKSHKAVEDNYRKNVGSVKINGRRFKFDGKWLILVSATGKHQSSLEGANRKRVAEFLANANKKGS